MPFPHQDDFWMGLAVTVVSGFSTLLAPLATTALLTLRKPRTVGRVQLHSAVENESNLRYHEHTA